MQKVLSGTIFDVQCLSSSGTIGKSSSASELLEHTGVLPGVWSVLELKDRHWCTGLPGVCGILQGVVMTVLQCVVVTILQGVVVTVLQGVVFTGLKEAWSMLDMWSMQGVFCKGIDKSLVSEPLS